MPIQFAGLTDRGRVRAANEDSWLAAPTQGLFVVSDGMGGHQAGALASKIVVETLPRLLAQAGRGPGSLSDASAADGVRSALIDLNDHLRREASKQPTTIGMGATVVLAWIEDAHVLVAHLGDSRAYLLREGALERLTKDHSLVQLLLDCGQISPEDAIHHPSRNQITQYVGMVERARPDVRALTLLPGDQLLLCSDGLTGPLNEPELARILSGTRPEVACRRLVDAANAAGGQDNISCIVVSCKGRK